MRADVDWGIGTPQVFDRWMPNAQTLVFPIARETDRAVARGHVHHFGAGTAEDTANRDREAPFSAIAISL